MNERGRLGAALVGLVVVVAGMAVVAADRSARLDSLERGNALLEQEIAASRATGPSIDAEAEERLRRRLSAIRELTSRGPLVAGLPASLSLEKIDTGWWTRLEVRGGVLELEGEGMAAADAAAALDGVRAVPCLGDVSLDSVRRVTRGSRTVHSYRIRARVLVDDPEHAVPCEIDVPPPAGRDPFLSADADEQIRRRVTLPALRRHPLRDLRLVRSEAGETAGGGRVVIEVPGGEQFPAVVGTVVGDGRARITQILPDMILLSEDRVVDIETRAVRTRAFTMELQP